jgi:hypothetical protein
MKLNYKQLAYFFILGKSDNLNFGKKTYILNFSFKYKVFIPGPTYALICIDSTGYLTFNTYFVPDSVSCSNGEHFCEVKF